MTPELTMYLKELGEHGGFCDGPIDPFTRATCGDLPIHWAALNGHPELVRELIELGVDANERGESDHTVLDYAILHEHREIVSYLLSIGAHAYMLDEPDS